MSENTSLGAQPAVGTPFESRGRTITEADLVSFAALTGDWHPQHADAGWAASGPFGERVASLLSTEELDASLRKWRAQIEHRPN